MQSSEPNEERGHRYRALRKLCQTRVLRVFAHRNRNKVINCSAIKAAGALVVHTSDMKVKSCKCIMLQNLQELLTNQQVCDVSGAP